MVWLNEKNGGSGRRSPTKANDSTVRTKSLVPGHRRWTGGGQGGGVPGELVRPRKRRAKGEMEGGAVVTVVILNQCAEVGDGWRGGETQ
jgi:hypothetical protein